MRLFLFGTIVFSTMFLVQARADIRLFQIYHDRYLQSQELTLSANSVGLNQPQLQTQVERFNQKLDHNDSADARTFSQRYYVNSQFASSPKEQAPVLLHICGESECTSASVNALRGRATALGAHIVAVEHRYYGDSFPTKELTTENLKYLSTDFALKDVAAIQKYLMGSLQLKGKWIAIGGSYAGSLAAYYRQKYPELVVGALSSSGPVMAKENFEEYDLHVATVVGQECGAKMKEVVKKVEAVINNPAQLSLIKKKFHADVMREPVDFMYLIADMGALAVQYGYKERFCELLTSGDALDGYAQFTREIFMLWGMGPTDGSAQGAEKVTVTSSREMMRQWFYQSCTEYGYWQNAYHDSNVTVRSSLINADYHRGICKRLFGLNIAGNEKEINKKFYEPLLSQGVSNILYTNGSNDPWMMLSITKENGNYSENGNVVSVVMDGAAHCEDLSGSTNPNVQKGQALFIDLAKTWLGL